MGLTSRCSRPGRHDYSSLARWREISIRPVAVSIVTVSRALAAWWANRRERSEANCLTSGCKSRRRRSPCGAVVISGSLRGDSWAGSPDVQAPGGQVGLEPPWSGQHRGQAIRRAVAKANGLNAEMGPRTKLIQAEYWRCQEFLPSTRWPVPMRKDGAVPVSDLPAEVEGGNPGEPSSKSSEGLESRQEDP